MSAVRYRRAVTSLARDLNCTVDYIRDPLAAMMYVEESPPRIEIAPVVDDRTYAVALHELGHVALGHTQGRPPNGDKKFYFENGVLKSEAQAWEWALANGASDLSAETLNWCYRNGLGSYESGARFHYGRQTSLYRLGNGNRHHVGFMWDNPNDVVITNVKRRLHGADTPVHLPT